MTESTRPAEGSFSKYLNFSGDFVTTIAIGIQRADPSNRARLRLGFPQMVAAFEHHNWDEAPPGFEPRYNAGWPKDGGGMITREDIQTGFLHACSWTLALQARAARGDPPRPLVEDADCVALKELVGSRETTPPAEAMDGLTLEEYAQLALSVGVHIGIEIARASVKREAAERGGA